MNADYPHDVAKREVANMYNITRAETLDQWVIWILEYSHVYIWSPPNYVRLGPLYRQASVDETFWGRSRVNKSMAPTTTKHEGIWVWGAVGVTPDQKCHKVVFRVFRSKAEAIDNKPRGTAELQGFV